MDDSKANYLIDSDGQLDLAAITLSEIRWYYGTFRPYSTGSGRDKQHFSRSGVVTPIGDIQEDLYGIRWPGISPGGTERNGWWMR